MKAQAGVARTDLTPIWSVELTGWGYYLERTWQDIHDPLHATALVVESEESTVAIVSVDLMVISAEFTANVRQQVASVTGIPPSHILVCCTHTHNAPASGGLLGVGEVDPLYEEWAARQTSTATILAWRQREPATFGLAQTCVDDLTFNRTRENGPIDPTLTLLRIDRNDGSPLAVVVNFQGHPTVSTVLRPHSVSRDVPGEVCYRIEESLPGCTVMYIQGACGDVNFHRFYTDETRAHEPALRISDVALQALEDRSPLTEPIVCAQSQTVRLPTRRWTDEEIATDRSEAEQRLRDRDMTAWRESIGRVMTNRPDDMVARHGGDEWKAMAAMCRFNLEWTVRMLADIDKRPEWLETKIQAIRIGDLTVVANPSELFTAYALDLRTRIGSPSLMIACYANSRIGYLPDGHDIERQSYAAYQSPKYCNQFPFTSESGSVFVRAMTTLANSML